ncbi:MAG: amidohydrolase family protein [Paraglaciecola sp.]|uniref:amidohydrolase family protein n=1 Tax=Paraglaciecola sp. TaxID=1920173 RepID=UPI00273D8AD9|nr:amidohydrolase family protein [Paraglaciecola sp.]MDP5033175.1 amidohydrolase family protein [Paraglaciecola sp.]MDP5133906.1 amidohydrolase family protein [Paraglaciecola sp.]
MIKINTTLLGMTLVCAFAACSHVFAAEETKEKPKWDVLNPPFPLQSLRIETEQTTWSSLDITPDGKTMVFDMLGDLYEVPLSGGQAKALTQDFAWNIHPAVSPDGKHIAFISDRGGISNLWVMDKDGTNLKQLSSEKNNLIHSPKWSPDGEYIVVTKGIMSSRSIPAGEIWLYHKSGGDGLALKERVNGKKDQKNIADPAFSVDGKYVYFTQDISGGSTFSYNRDPLKGLFAITRYELANGDEETYISGTGGAVVPTPSPDGKHIAFIRRVQEKTVLFVKEISTGIETPLYFDLERDMQEGFGTEGYFAYFDWTPDSKNIVFWTAGKFHRLDVEDGSVNTIPVKVNAELHYADALRFDVDVAPDTFKVKMARWTQRSQDGSTLLFQALGKLYTKDIKSGKIKRLTKQNEYDELYPRYSNDGKSIVYTTWNDQKLGTVRTISVSGRNDKVVSTTPGHYIEPSFSTDDKMITYQKATGGYLLSPNYSVEPGVYVLDLKSGKNIRVSQSGWAPHFAGDNSRVYLTTSVPGSSYPETQLISVDLNGEDKREHLYGADNVSEYRLSNDKKWVAFVNQYNAYVAPFVDTGKRVNIGPKSSALPVKQLSSHAGEYLTWRADSQAVSWYHGANYYERELKDAFDFIAGAPETLPEPVTEGISVSFEQPSDKPTGYKAIVGGNIVTMRNANNEQEVIENGVILIKDNRIEKVGGADTVKIPKGTLIVDAKGKTVVPGLVDTHAHGAQGSNEIIPQQNWAMYSNVAFGVTTIHDPSNDTTEIFSAAELQKAGKIVAPRIYSTGTILYGAEAYAYKAVINTLEDALYHVQRLKDTGAISVKSYNQPARSQRQQILAAAKELGMMVVPEGGGKFQQNISMLVDGHTGLEHSLPIATGYGDLTSLWAATKFGYTPTFVVSYGGMMGEEYMYDRNDVWLNPRLLRYTPSFLLDERAIVRPTAPDSQYNHPRVAAYAKTLRDKGVSVHIGAHGQREGLAAHWELQLMTQGGFTPWEALRAATIDGATHLGMDKHIGSIEEGKLADFFITDGNVLNDVSRSEYVDYTVLNGRIYESATMNEVGSKNKRHSFFFENNHQLYMPKETADAIKAKAQKHHWVH